MRILIVDDQPLIRKGIMHVLHYERADQQFIEAATVKEAIELCKTNPIDVIFVDLHLKDGSGFDLISCIKAPGESSPKIILLASTISIFEFRRAKDLDVEGYLLKEADADDLKYAYSLILRGEKYYPAKLVEKALSDKERDGICLLTNRELEVLAELSKGLTNSQIGNNLFISEGTAKKHVSSILSKLNMSNRMEVVVYAYRLAGKS
ncbi:MAG: response regulator transcription factor [Bacillota bacterium]|nr:response regulator transcription factor [Bacillota bacterium]NLM07841.1 response regulator transcription factor [Clostridiales Family XIII bacterium]